MKSKLLKKAVAIIVWMLVKGSIKEQHYCGSVLIVCIKYQNRLWSPLTWLFIICKIIHDVIMDGLRETIPYIKPMIFGVAEEKHTLKVSPTRENKYIQKSEEFRFLYERDF